MLAKVAKAIKTWRKKISLSDCMLYLDMGSADFFPELPTSPS